MWALLLVASTLLIFTIPLLPALREWRGKEDIASLPIVRSHDGRVQRFADSFRDYIEVEIEAISANALDDTQRARLHIVKLEDQTEVPQHLLQNGLCDHMLVSYHTLTLPSDTVFEREIYSKQSLLGGEHNRLRAVLADQELILGKGSMVLRWAHATSVSIGADCVLLGKISATTDITIATGCTFTTLHAPRMQFGATPPRPGPPHPVPTAACPDTDDQRAQGQATDEPANIRQRVDGMAQVPDGSVFHGDLIATKTVTVGRGAIVTGSIKSNGALIIGDDAIIEGALVSVKALSIGRNCKIKGPVVAETHIVVGTQTVIGEANLPTTVTARTIDIADGVTAFGSIRARDQGRVIAWEQAT